ncbi:MULTISPECIES: type II toxin-antitoxin system RelE/ParE family toxin [unclassified Agrobacterium]|uniref:type II toxin-antitoxin system RelE/ParE family toxin n=1 Tax=unclassified Agrobacterium TaxID=2632611 RepID=UPI00083D28CE|nr:MULTISPECIES: type II toxin-antitoxin system RelE/ParE family toxin [unclassified Agrobacterium]AOG11199.1 putative plasmid stablization protein [Agrobacterium sp. RAC06]QGG91692.1 type II toxin-antitoxin system RelE/ParE family toxin [Agrobacterium sp. MA01]
MVEVRLSTEADADILDILTRTYADFGGGALLRYEFLIVTALSDLAVSNWRNGVVSRPELGPGIHSYHLRHSRDRARHPSGIVRRPRHFILYRHVMAELIGVGRILHDAMEVERHLPLIYGDE